MNRKIINIQCRIQCVSAMKDYETKSLEVRLYIMSVIEVSRLGHIIVTPYTGKCTCAYRIVDDCLSHLFA